MQEMSSAHCQVKIVPKCRFHRILTALAAIFYICPLLVGVSSAQWFESQLPPLPPPSQYGNHLLDRAATKADQLPVAFSHWQHRSKYTCKVCHVELEFEMKVNATPITMEKNNKGQYCGFCHDGNRSFSTEECKRCHTGDIATGSNKFKKFASDLPRTDYGNRVDWVRAAKKKMIKPKKTIRPGEDPPVTFKKMLILEAEWANIPYSIFPHAEHVYWLDCQNCHPDIFNIKKKTTKHFLMTYMFDGKFCGACHLNVAFPLDDCTRCHPTIKRKSPPQDDD